MRIVVAGTIVADTIEHAAGVTESLGGIAHTVSVLSALGGERHDIVPLCRAGAACRERIEAWARRLDGVRLDAVCWLDGPQPRVHLSYPDADRAGERVERLRDAPPPLDVDDVAAGAGADLVLINYITGADLTALAVAALRRTTGRLYVDVHSLALGTAADGVRYLRPRDDWQRWLGPADVVQCNRGEAAAVCGLPPDDAADDEVVAALSRRLRDEEDPRTWLLTLGAAGAVLFEPALGASREPRAIAAPVVDAVDPTGAGDAFGAGYVTAWLTGADPVDAARAAVHAASSACTLAGAPTPRELLRVL